MSRMFHDQRKITRVVIAFGVLGLPNTQITFAAMLHVFMSTEKSKTISLSRLYAKYLSEKH